MKQPNGGKFGLMAGALCAALGLSSLPASAANLQFLLTATNLDDQIITVRDTVFLFQGAFFDPDTNDATNPLVPLWDERIASAIEVTPYTDPLNFSTIGLQFSVTNLAGVAPTNPLGNPPSPESAVGLNFTILAGTPVHFKSAAMFVLPDSIPDLAPESEFAMISQTCELDTANCVENTFMFASASTVTDPILNPTGELLFAPTGPLFSPFLNPDGIVVQPQFLTNVVLDQNIQGTINSFTWVQAFQVPEPGSMALLGLGLAGLGLMRRRRLLPH